MTRSPAVLALMVLTAVPATAQQDARQVLQLVAEKQAARMASVNNYVIIQRVQGAMEAPFYYEAFTPEGGGPKLFRLVDIAEWQARNPNGLGVGGAEMAVGMQGALNEVAGQLGTQMIGTPAGRLLGPGAMDQMVAGYSEFLEAAATYRPNDGRADAQRDAADIAAFAGRARLLGRVQVNGQEAFHLVADGLSDLPAQEVGEATFVVERVGVWVDTEELVQLRLRIEGVMKAGKKRAPIAIELNELDYASVGPLYEPLSNEMLISGLMAGMELDPKERQKMEKARAEMEKLQQQLAQMPASQRQMVQGQVDKAMAQLNAMTGRDIIKSDVEFMVYSINKGPPFEWLPFCPSLEPDAQPFLPSAVGSGSPPPGACG